jgi:hypothetical protein
MLSAYPVQPTQTTDLTVFLSYREIEVVASSSIIAPVMIVIETTDQKCTNYNFVMETTQ